MGSSRGRLSNRIAGFCELNGKICPLQVQSDFIGRDLAAGGSETEVGDPE